MKLSIIERVQIQGILPTEGRMIEMIITRSLRNLMIFNEQEVKEFELKDGDNGILKFNPQKIREVDFDFTDEQLQLLKQSVKSTDESGKITADLLPLCEKVMNAI